MDCEEELDIAIKQAANLTNWRLKFFLEPPSVGLLQPLKQRERLPRKGERGEGGVKRDVESGCSRGTEKIHRGSSVRLSPLLSLSLSRFTASSLKKRGSLKRVVRGSMG